jgi:hypothetical protein
MLCGNSVFNAKRVTISHWRSTQQSLWALEKGQDWNLKCGTPLCWISNISTFCWPPNYLTGALGDGCYNVDGSGDSPTDGTEQWHCTSTWHNTFILCSNVGMKILSILFNFSKHWLVLNHCGQSFSFLGKNFGSWQQKKKWRCTNDSKDLSFWRKWAQVTTLWDK